MIECAYRICSASVEIADLFRQSLELFRLGQHAEVSANSSRLVPHFMHEHLSQRTYGCESAVVNKPPLDFVSCFLQFASKIGNERNSIFRAPIFLDHFVDFG